MDMAVSAPEAAQRVFVDWTPARIEELTRRWNVEGQTASVIGDAMGISKNAVIAKARRIGLQNRPSPIKRAAGIFRLPQVKSAKPSARSAVAAQQNSGLALKARKEGTARPLSIKPGFNAPLGSSTCQFPIGHPGEPDFHFCTARAIRGKPYCPEHHGVCYVRPGSALYKHVQRDQDEAVKAAGD